MTRIAIHVSLVAGIVAFASTAMLNPCLAQVPPYQFSMGAEGQRLQQNEDAANRYRGYADNMREDLAQWRTYRTYAQARMQALKAAGREGSDEYQTLSRWMKQEEQDEPLVSQRLANTEQWINHYQAQSEMERWNLSHDREAAQEANSREQQRQQEAAWHTQLDQIHAQHMADLENAANEYGGYGGYRGGHSHYRYGGRLNPGGAVHASGGGGHARPR